jgi:hypothetical protein
MKLQQPFCVYFFGGLECVGHSFAYVAHFVFWRDVWIRTQRAAVASRRATNQINCLFSHKNSRIIVSKRTAMSLP